MARVRGRLVMNAIEYVEQRFGREAHQRVVETMPRERWGPFVGPLHETSWEPAEDAVAYLQTAKRLFAPEEDAFFREVGRYAGRLERQTQGYQPMVKDPATAVRMGPAVWSTFYDTGRLEVSVISPLEATARVLGFDVSPVLCERTCGAWEGLLSTEGLRATATELACVHRGAEFCEMHVRWTPVSGDA